MKNSVRILFVFLFVSFSFNTVSALAETKNTFSEGIYSISDLKLLPNVSYKIENVSGGKSFISIFNNDLILEESIRLESNSLKYILKPMQYDYKIVIIGTGQLLFS